MCNTTQDKFKKAIKAQYEIEKIGQYSKFLESPSQANLRKLCWERFKDNSNADDLSVFRTFFDFDFSNAKKNQLKEQTDKFRPIRAFFLGITESPADETIDLAAILVNFEFRPYNNFRKSIEVGNYTEINVDDEKEIEISVGKDKPSSDDEENKNPQPETPPRRISFTERFLRLLKKSKRTIIAILFIFSLTGTGTTIYLAFFKKDNMQWSKDYFAVVDEEGIEGNPNEIIQYDDNLLDFKKIRVCDTTTWFANGKSIIWYAKTNNEVDFFTTCGNGRHPESGSTIRPVTQHIFNKYKEPCGSK